MPSRTFSRLVRSSLLAAAGSAALAAPGAAAIQSASDPIVRFQTSRGNIDVELFPGVAPKTVANFLHYLDNGTYGHTFFHRSVANFVIQGGGYEYVGGAFDHMATDPPVGNEYKLPNLTGALAMAKLGNDPNSATDEFFFNTRDNTTTLGPTNNGGFTVFGQAIDSQSLAVITKINALPTHDADALYTGAYNPSQPPLATVPLANWTPGQAVDYPRDLVFLTICRLAPPDTCDPTPPPYAPTFVSPPYTDGSPPAPAPPDDAPVTPPAPVPPAPSPRRPAPPLPRVGRVTVSLARRTVSLALRCPPSGACRGTVTLAAGRTPLGRARYAGGHSAAITAVVRLTAAGRHLLAGRHRRPVRATATLVADGTATGAAPVTVKVTV